MPKSNSVKSLEIYLALTNEPMVITKPVTLRATRGEAVIGIN